MTRNRAIGNVPNDLMVEYYKERGSAGLIITEGTSPSPNGLGYPRIPGAFSAVPVAGWKKVTDAVHANGAKIFLQLMHTGRIGHPNNLPAGTRVLAPSAVTAAGEIYTDAEGPKPHATPKAITEADIKTNIKTAIGEYRRRRRTRWWPASTASSFTAPTVKQFIRPNSNIRTDAYGGPIENRARFVLEVAKAVIAAIGKDKVGIRPSPLGAFNDMPRIQRWRPIIAIWRGS